jgi:glycosyltransferase involved in cell wall biosynthesis
MLPLVSIIIPFYNEAQYLQRAVTSAIQQSYGNIEFILVNDGSTDNSLEIAESLQAGHPEIHIISTANKSLGHARNTGLAIARGAYIFFLDSDDVLHEDAIAVLVANMGQAQSDIAIGKFHAIDTNVAPAGWKLDGSPKTGTEAALAMYQYQIAYTAWAKLYKANIVQQLRFPEGLWFEDRPFVLGYFLKSEKVSFEATSVLQYQSRPTSITRRLISTKRITDSYNIYLLELATIKDHQEEPLLKKVIDRHQINAFIETLILLYFDKDKLPELQEVQTCFDNTIKAFKQQLAINKSTLGKRDRLDIMLLQLNKAMGWKLTFGLLPLFKRKKCKAVFKLRAS